MWYTIRFASKKNNAFVQNKRLWLQPTNFINKDSKYKRWHNHLGYLLPLYCPQVGHVQVAQRATQPKVAQVAWDAQVQVQTAPSKIAQGEGPAPEEPPGQLPLQKN